MIGVKLPGQKNIEVKEYPYPQKRGKGEIIINVKAAGICGSDLITYSTWGQEVIPGHEIVGEVKDTDRSSFFNPGERVLVNSHVTCGHCKYCKNGDWIFCPELKLMGIDRNGGWAEYVSVPEKSCFFLPEDISWELGVLITDSLGTAYTAIKKFDIVPNTTLGIFGAGPIGLCALTIAKKKGAKVFVFEKSPYRINLAKKLGADVSVDPDQIEIRKLWESHNILEEGFDYVIDCTGSALAIQNCPKWVKKRGKIVLVGVADEVSFKIYDHIIKKELQIFGSRNFNIREYESLLNVAKGIPELSQIITHRFTLKEAKEALDYSYRKVTGKVIFVPDSPGKY